MVPVLAASSLQAPGGASSHSVHRHLALPVLAAICSFAPGAVRAAESPMPRERVSFNADWRFIQGDPANSKTELDYQRLKPWLLASASDAGRELFLDVDGAMVDDFQAKERNAYNGLCPAIVRSTGRPGSITLKATSPGLRPATLALKAK